MVDRMLVHCVVGPHSRPYLAQISILPQTTVSCAKDVSGHTKRKRLSHPDCAPSGELFMAGDDKLPVAIELGLIVPSEVADRPWVGGMVGLSKEEVGSQPPALETEVYSRVPSMAEPMPMPMPTCPCPRPCPCPCQCACVVSSVRPPVVRVDGHLAWEPMCTYGRMGCVGGALTIVVAQEAKAEVGEPISRAWRRECTPLPGASDVIAVAKRQREVGRGHDVVCVQVVLCKVSVTTKEACARGALTVIPRRADCVHAWASGCRLGLGSGLQPGRW